VVCFLGIPVYKGIYAIQDYSVSMYLRQAWNDPRLAFNVTSVRMRTVRLDRVDVWIPDTFLRNEKDANFHRVSVTNRLLRLSADGDLWYVNK